MFSRRLDDQRRRLGENGFDAAIVTDDDNVYFLAGYYLTGDGYEQITRHPKSTDETVI
jgi:Xaa-Pro aminopeptidase